MSNQLVNTRGLSLDSELNLSVLILILISSLSRWFNCSQISQHLSPKIGKHFKQSNNQVLARMEKALSTLRHLNVRYE